MIPFSLRVVGLLKLIPDGRQVRMSPNLAEFARAYPDWYHETLAELYDLAAGRKIKPVVAQHIPLVVAVRAHERFERGGNAGKVVLAVENG